MALVVKSENVTNRASDRLWITEKSGLYDAADNTGGWGTPNPDQSKSALVAIAIRKASAADEMFAPVSSAAFFNPSASNSDEHSTEFFYINDGVFYLYLIRIPVSNDGVTDLESNALSEGDYFYLTGSNDIYQRVSSQNVLVPDYRVLIDISQDNVIKSFCQNYYGGQQTIARQQKYRDFQEARQGKMAEDPIFLKCYERTLDIISQEYSFRSGLLVDAQDQAETALDEYDIDNVNVAQQF